MQPTPEGICSKVQTTRLLLKTSNTSTLMAIGIIKTNTNNL